MNATDLFEDVIPTSRYGSPGEIRIRVEFCLFSRRQVSPLVEGIQSRLVAVDLAPLLCIVPFSGLTTTPPGY